MEKNISEPPPARPKLISKEEVKSKEEPAP